MTEKAKQELFLKFNHIRVEATLTVSMAFDVEKQLAFFARPLFFCLPDKLEKSLGGILEPLVLVDEVIERNRLIAELHLQRAARIHNCCLRCQNNGVLGEKLQELP